MANREKRGLKLTGPALIVARVAAACLTVFALGLDMSVELPTKVIATLSEGSFFGYINNLRCREAERMLRSGEETVGEVARRCGFDNLSYFTRTFRAVVGKTPSELRER